MQTWDRTLKGQLKVAWDEVQSWKMMRPIKSRVPINHSVRLAVAYVSVTHATQLDRKNVLCWFSFSFCVRLGSHALLRPKELFELTKRCLRLPTSHVVSLSHVAVCTVLDPKNRAFLGRLQVRMVKDQATVDWLLWYTAGLIPCQYLWPYSRQRFASCLETCSRVPRPRTTWAYTRLPTRRGRHALA